MRGMVPAGHSPDGAIILDDSEGYWGGEERQTYPILELMRAQGYRRVDFFGHSPGRIRPHCKSFFFRSECFLFEGTEAPRRTFWYPMSRRASALGRPAEPERSPVAPTSNHNSSQ